MFPIRIHFLRIRILMSPFKFLPNTKLRIFLTFIFLKKSVVGGRTEVHFEKNALCTKIPGFYPTLQWARLFCRSYLEKLNSGTISLRLKIRDLLYSSVHTLNVLFQAVDALCVFWYDLQ